MIYLKKHGIGYFITGIAAAVTLPIVILTLSVWLVTFDSNYYYKEYVKYDVGVTQSLGESDLHLITKNLLDYLSDKKDNLNFVAKRDQASGKQFFSDRDKTHMIDVKKIILNLRNVGIVATMVFTIALFIIAKKPKYRMNIHRFLGTGAILGILPFIGLGILMAIDFNKYFILFHQMFFSNDLWLLDPKFDNLVNIFPEEFFSDMAIRICSGYIVGLMAVIVFSLSTIRKKGGKQNENY